MVFHHLVSSIQSTLPTYVLNVEGTRFSALADDIKIFRTADSEDDFTPLQQTINALQSWSSTSKLPISKIKTKSYIWECQS